MQVMVSHKFIHEAPRKLRLICDMVRGLPADTAAAELNTLTHKASIAVRKAILAGIAAAKQQGLDPNALMIGAITVDEGPKMRRVIMLGRGRSQRIQKRMCHLHVTITDQPIAIASSRAYKKEIKPTVNPVKSDTQGSK